LETHFGIVFTKFVVHSVKKLATFGYVVGFSHTEIEADFENIELVSQ
jgi:hypothetical protein